MSNFPSFGEFRNQINMDKFSYDLDRMASDALHHSTDLFTEEQYLFMTKSIMAVQFALLQQYHEWLSEQLR